MTPRQRQLSFLLLYLVPMLIQHLQRPVILRTMQGLPADSLIELLD